MPFFFRTYLNSHLHFSAPWWVGELPRRGRWWRCCAGRRRGSRRASPRRRRGRAAGPRPVKIIIGLTLLMKKSQTRLDAQNVAGCRPVMIWTCFALVARSLGEVVISFVPFVFQCQSTSVERWEMRRQGWRVPAGEWFRRHRWSCPRRCRPLCQTSAFEPMLLSLKKNWDPESRNTFWNYQPTSKADLSQSSSYEITGCAGVVD